MMELWKKILWNILPNRKKEEQHSDARKTGASKSPKDNRDILATICRGPRTTPAIFELKGLSRVENQGRYNSCVAQAITTAIETLAKKYGVPNYMELSRMHCWNEARQLTWGAGWKVNKGVFIRDGWKAAYNGVTIEKLFPYQKAYWLRDLDKSFIWRWYPPFNYKFLRFQNKGETEAAIKEVLLDKRLPIVFGISITHSFSFLTGKEVFKPRAGEGRGGGHAMLIVGWDDTRKAFKIMNSWGTRWGDRGFFWADKDWILNEAWDFSYCERK